MVSHLNSFKYVEKYGEFLQTPFQTFEVIPQTTPVNKATPTIPKVTRIPPRMASLKDARVVVEEGGDTIQGQLPNIPYKSDKFGLGFTSEAQRAIRRARANSGRPSFCINNNGVCKNQVNTVEDTDSDCDIDSWIFPTTGNGLNFWKAENFFPDSATHEFDPFIVFLS